MSMFIGFLRNTARPSHGRGRRFDPFSAHHFTGVFEVPSGTERQQVALAGTAGRAGDERGYLFVPVVACLMLSVTFLSAVAMEPTPQPPPPQSIKKFHDRVPAVPNLATIDILQDSPPQPLAFQDRWDGTHFDKQPKALPMVTPATGWLR
jgi:hypothetical protein